MFLLVFYTQRDNESDYCWAVVMKSFVVFLWFAFADVGRVAQRDNAVVRNLDRNTYTVINMWLSTFVW